MSSLKQTVLTSITRAATRVFAASGDLIAQLYLPQHQRDPKPVYDKIRDRGPVYRSRTGYAAVSSHELCHQVLRDARFGIRDTNGRLTEDQALPFGGAPSLLELDPPEHGRLRRLVAPAFRPKLIAGYRPRIEQTTARLLDAVDGEFDLINDFAAPLPITVISDLLGIPDDRRHEFAGYGTLVGQALDGRLTARQHGDLDAAVAELTELFTVLMDRRRRDPGDDVISVLVNAVDRDQVTVGELISTCQLLLIAGFETTVNLIGNAVFQLQRHPEQWRLLLADPDLAPLAVEEVLRFDPPVPVTGRTCQSVVELAGTPIRPNTTVLTMLVSANRDPEVYSEPDTLDITRTGGPEHFAFSSGIHYCLGAQLARIEGEIALRALAERLPGLSLAGEPRLRPSASIRGFLHLPVAA